MKMLSEKKNRLSFVNIVFLFLLTFLCLTLTPVPVYADQTVGDWTLSDDGALPLSYFLGDNFNLVSGLKGVYSSTYEQSLTPEGSIIY